MKKIIFLVISVILVSWSNVWAQDDPFDPITKAIQESDAGSLSESFNLTVELQLPGNEGTYSYSQAEMIMKDFFKKCPPDSFKIIRKGTTDPISMFAIGDYSSGNKLYQVYIHLSKEKEKYFIHKMKFNENKQ